MKTLISTAAIVVAGLLSAAAQAQTAPPNGWSAHISGCFSSDPTFSNNGRGFERLPTPSTAQRINTTISGQQARVAVWRQECPNNAAFPILMVRFEFLSLGAVVLQNRDFELIQGGVTTIAEEPGFCASASCRAVSLPINDERGQIQFATWAIAQPRDPSVLLRNAFQFRFRGTTDALTLGGSGGGGTGDIPLAGRLNGTFFDPARSGEGIMIDFFDIGSSAKGVFVSWYTYDDAGNPMWLVGNTELAPNGTQVDIPLIVTTGGRFGPLFRADNIRRTPWGSMNIRFPTCNSAVLRYTRTQDGQTGTYNLSRLGPASGVSC